MTSIKDNEEEIAEALAQDLNKPRFETELAEYGWLLNDIVFVTRNLHKWVKDEKAPDIELQFKFMSPKIRKDPLGCVLVIGYVATPSHLGSAQLTVFSCRIVPSTFPSN